MYEFVDLTEKGTRNVSSSIQTIFNDINLDKSLTDERGSFQTLTVQGRSNVINRIATQEVVGMDGLLESERATLSERSVTVKYQIEDQTNRGLRARYNELNLKLQGSQQQLKFTDEEAYFYGTLSKHEVPEEESNTLVGKITFLCSNPIKYGEEYEAFLKSDESTIVEVMGTAATKPVFELDILQKTTYVLVAKSDQEYMMIGQPHDVNNEAFEKYETILFDDASSITGWTSANAGEINGTITGTMSSNGYRFQTVDYGVGSSWHGPAIKQGLVNPISDFRVEARMTFSNTEAEDIGRIEVYGLDINGNQLFKLAMKDILGGKRKAFGEARAGGGVTNHFLIAESGDKGWEWNDFEGLLRVERDGREWRAYIAQITDGRHTASRTSDVWTDHEGSFTAELAQVVFHSAQNSTFQFPMQGLDSIRVEKINQSPKGVPYIVGPGDRVIFDHKTNEVFINGELRKDLKNLGARHFSISPGETIISLLPTENLAGRMSWAPAYI